MGRAINKLNVKQAERDLAPGLYGDGGGLYLQVSEQKTKAWVFRFMIAGRARKMGLGDFERISLKDAREKAKQAHSLVVDGKDPIEERNARKAALALQAASTRTFKWCAETYVSSQEGQWRNAKHRQQWRNTLETYAYPVIGDLAVADVGKGHLIRILEPIWTEKNETAARLRGRIETILSWSKVRGYRDGDNPAAWKGNLKEALPKISRTKRIQHHPALPYEDVPAFMAELSAREGISAKALALTILTSARTNETIGATWPEIDLDTKLWTIPASRMGKNGKEHRIPLSAPAIKLLKALPREGKHVFPGPKAGKPISNMAMLELVRDVAPGFTVHGFRSSFKDWCTEQTAYDRDLIEFAMSHTVDDKVEAAYRRGDMLKKRQRLMADWGAYCDSTASGRRRRLRAEGSKTHAAMVEAFGPDYANKNIVASTACGMKLWETKGNNVVSIRGRK